MENVYKVVGVERRYGSNGTGFEYEHEDLNLDHWFDEHENSPYAEDVELAKLLKPYFPKYIKGTTVKAVPGSPGILCFKTEIAAQSFIRRSFYSRPQMVTIIQVIGLGKPLKKYELNSGCFNIKNLINYKKRSGEYLYGGTVAFKSVRVLE